MRARTIGQIASLIAGHMGGKTATAAPATVAAPAEASATEDVDLEVLSDEDIDRPARQRMPQLRKFPSRNEQRVS
jgi:hypothetical protein